MVLPSLLFCANFANNKPKIKDNMEAVQTLFRSFIRPALYMTKETTTTMDASVASSNIQIENLNVSIGGNHILHDINLTIPNNEITCIIGPSGCGKSTLLKTINRLLDDTDDVKVEGAIMIDGENIYDRHVEVTHIRKKLGLLSQRPTPLPMSIYDNVAYGCKIHGMYSKKELKAVVEENLRHAGLWEEVKDRLNASPAELSIGQQQRLCIARGLAVRPRFILGDESTSALDPVSTHQIEKVFVQLKSQFGLILVTHTLPQAMRIADNVVFLYDGRVVEQGVAKEVLQHPSNELTRRYLSGAFDN